MKVCVITATKGRHQWLERNVRMFLDQTYENSVHLIYNNSCVPQRLNTNLPVDRVILVNNCEDKETKRPYATLGAIYRDAITYIPEDVDVVSFFDDDDMYLPNHIEEGIKGLMKGGKLAYKPYSSYFKSGDRVTLMNNTFEPSIFMKKEHLLKYGFSNTTSDQHLKWVDGLLTEGQIFEDKEGTPTLVYTWNSGVYKTSGASQNANNFSNYEKSSVDHGDGIISPAPRKDVALLFKGIKAYDIYTSSPQG